MARIFINFYHFLQSLFWVIWYRYPAKSLIVIGVTGTDGKTTTCHLIYEILKAAGFKVALVSTVAAFIGEEEIDTGFHVTTGDAKLLQPLLRKIVDKGFTHVVLETTSHSLDQNRVWGCNFYTGIVTNITHEHLDYHKTFENYKTAKMKLLQMAKNPIYKYEKSKLKVTNPKLVGDYNLYNIGAAEAVAKIFNCPLSTVHSVIKNFKGVQGRMEEIKLGQKFRAIVDFAHTPNALQQALQALQAQKAKQARIILVFGCAGLRDHIKRPMMGQIASQLADVVIVTAEDPRTENLGDIYKDIAAAGSIREDDRQKAIEMAVKMAKPGDIVVVTGKGHEKSMCFGTKEYPWSDVKMIECAISSIL